MNILNTNFFNYSFSTLKAYVAWPLSFQLSDQQNKIAIVASAIFALMAVYFLVHCFYARSRKWIIEGEDHVSIHEEPSPNAKENETAKQILEYATPLQPSKNQDGNEEDKIETSAIPQIQKDDYLSIENSEDYLIEDDPIELNDFDPGMFDEDVEKEDETEFQLSNEKQQVFKMDGKFVSLRTFKCIQKLEKDLALLDKTYGKAIDDGDCFWDAFAQGLASILGQQVTLKELRQQVSEEIKRLDQGPDEDNWIKKLMRHDLMDSYEDYRDKVAYTCQELLEREKGLPVWGQEKRDGVILCHLYKVNLKVYSVGCLDEDTSEMENEKNFYSEEAEFPEGQPYDKTIEIALYPGHFMPVRTKEKDF